MSLSLRGLALFEWRIKQMKTDEIGMRVPTLALCTLAALASWELTHEAIASPTTTSPQAATNNFVVPVASETPATVTAIAPPETLVAQQFSDSTSSTTNQSRETAQYYQQYQKSVVVPTVTETPTSTTPPASSFPQPQRTTSPVAPSAQPPAPAPRSQTQSPVNGDLVVMATDVQVVGATEELKQAVLNTVQTRPGGNTSQAQLQSDVTRILNTGLFANATVNSRSTPDGLSVTYQVTPVVVRSLQLTGAKVLTPAIANEIFSNQLGAPISPAALTQGVQRINQWYQQNGYSLARIASVRPQSNGVVTLEAAEGLISNVQFRFVNDQGETVDENGEPIQGRSRESFLKNEIKLQPGQVFREDVARQDLQRLYQLGLFSNVDISLDGDSRQVDVIYNLTEVPPRAVNVGAGYSDDSGLYGTINYQDQNIGGTGQRLGGNVLVGRRDLQFDANFTNPYRASQPDRLGYKIDAFRKRGISETFNEDVNLPNGDDVREGRFGGGVTLSKPVGDWQGSVGLNYTRTSIRDSDGNITPVDQFGNPLSFSGTGIDDLTTVSLGVSRDRRNNPVNPTDGSVLSLSTEQSIPVGQGNILSNRLQANYAEYVPVKLLNSSEKEPEVLAFNVQGGTTIGDLPPYRAFNLGGANSVRGYDRGGVGSGRSYVLASAEYRIPIMSTPVSGVLFADFASDLGSGDTVPGDPAGVRGKPGTGFGYGVGVRVKSPIGIIRADLGFNDQGSDRFQFGLGQRF